MVHGGAPEIALMEGRRVEGCIGRFCVHKDAIFECGAFKVGGFQFRVAEVDIGQMGVFEGRVF